MEHSWNAAIGRSLQDLDVIGRSLEDLDVIGWKDSRLAVDRALPPVILGLSARVDLYHVSCNQ